MPVVSDADCGVCAIPEKVYPDVSGVCEDAVVNEIGNCAGKIISERSQRLYHRCRIGISNVVRAVFCYFRFRHKGFSCGTKNFDLGSNDFQVILA